MEIGEIEIGTWRERIRLHRLGGARAGGVPPAAEVDDGGAKGET